MRLPRSRPSPPRLHSAGAQSKPTASLRGRRDQGKQARALPASRPRSELHACAQAHAQLHETPTAGTWTLMPSWRALCPVTLGRTGTLGSAQPATDPGVKEAKSLLPVGVPVCPGGERCPHSG